MATKDGDLLCVKKNEQCNKLVMELAHIKQNVYVKGKELIITNMENQLLELFHSEGKLRVKQQNQKVKLQEACIAKLRKGFEEYKSEANKLRKNIKDKEEIIANLRMRLFHNKAESLQIEENSNKLELEEQNQKVKLQEACIAKLRKGFEEYKSEANKLRKNIKDKEEIIANLRMRLFHNKAESLQIEENSNKLELEELDENKVERNPIDENYTLTLELEQLKLNGKYKELIIADLRKRLQELFISKAMIPRRLNKEQKLKKKQQVIQIALPDLKKVLTAYHINESEMRKREQDGKKNDALLDNLCKELEKCKSESVELREVYLDFSGRDIIIVALLTVAAPVAGVVLHSIFR